MDMVFNYLPDVFSYQSTRHYNYENNWLNDTTNRDSRVQYGSNNRPQAQGTVPKRVPRESCKDCPICQERQRRPLASYIRSKSRQDRKQDVLEEEEHEEDQEQQEKQEKPAPK
ncbi:hypothetical protein L9F63_012860 [Diploptera punctata]|uniref:Uncharacterized protein n=1 Tax=Diploptera punctata TaxID=6984 RepID=A0AAD8ACS2_DIPPU|nr:hypothetical protein L9F63_012860 [Diploptera punctata]